MGTNIDHEASSNSDAAWVNNLMRKLNRRPISVWTLATFGAVAATLVACQFTEASAASVPPVSLRYSGSAKSAYFFDLENHTDHPLYLWATKSILADAIPLDTAIECPVDPNPPEVLIGNKKFKESLIANFPLIDFGGKQPPTIKVAPGRRLRLRLSDVDASTLGKHKGGRCTLRLLLRNADGSPDRDEPVGPVEFQN
jgi:hypothetical protein